MLFKVHVTQGKHLISKCLKCGCKSSTCELLGFPLFSVRPWMCVLLSPTVAWAGMNWGSSPAKATAAHGFQPQRSFVSHLEQGHCFICLGMVFTLNPPSVQGSASTSLGSAAWIRSWLRHQGAKKLFAASLLGEKGPLWCR